ncbi:DUF397 domain-containing protein [Nocardiopsis sp. NPDC058631]|uniref:DUF397 domain-containing protein n=1 Tax=Nocardiopsis sp. NPDC058631 TaxID=3346566 RepID=UPI00365FD1B0
MTERSIGWITSSYSDGNQCVEVGHTTHGSQVRDSKDPKGANLRFSPQEWSALVDASTPR